MSSTAVFTLKNIPSTLSSIELNNVSDHPSTRKLTGMDEL